MAMISNMVKRLSSFGKAPTVDAQPKPPQLLLEPDPNMDGVDHINIWNKGKTELGRFLNQTSRSDFVHPEYGPFHSVMGFWHWIKSYDRDDNYRYLSGGRIKKYATENPGGETFFIKDYQEVLLAANYEKIMQKEEMKKLFVESTLPFDHYYLFGDSNVLVKPFGREWVCKMYEDLRIMIRAGKKPADIDYSQYAVTKK